MITMLEYYRTHPLTAAIVIAAVVAAVIVFIKVAIASERRAKNNQKLYMKLEDDKKLRDRFSSLTRQMIENSDSAELFRGVGLNLLKRVSDAPDLNGEFERLTEEQKLIYSAFLFTEDSKEGMSNFFKLNGRPVTDFALSGAEKLFSREFAVIVRHEYDAYDPDNEEVSCIPSEIERDDAGALEYIDGYAAEKIFGDYIKENADMFLN